MFRTLDLLYAGAGFIAFHMNTACELKAPWLKLDVVLVLRPQLTLD